MCHKSHKEYPGILMTLRNTCETAWNIAVSQHDQGHSMYKSFTNIQFHTKKAKALIEKTTFLMKVYSPSTVYHISISVSSLSLPSFLNIKNKSTHHLLQSSSCAVRSSYVKSTTAHAPATHLWLWQLFRWSQLKRKKIHASHYNHATPTWPPFALHSVHWRESNSMRTNPLVKTL